MTYEIKKPMSKKLFLGGGRSYNILITPGNTTNFPIILRKNVSFKSHGVSTYYNGMHTFETTTHYNTTIKLISYS